MEKEEVKRKRAPGAGRPVLFPGEESVQTTLILDPTQVRAIDALLEEEGKSPSHEAAWIADAIAMSLRDIHLDSVLDWKEKDGRREVARFYRSMPKRYYRIADLLVIDEVFKNRSEAVRYAVDSCLGR